MQPTPEQAALAKIREAAEKKYPRRLTILARRLDWDKAKLSRILSGDQQARLSELFTLCAVLGVSLSQILHSVGA